MSATCVAMFSGGKGSAVAAKLHAEQHGTDDMVLLFADTRGEDPDTWRFMREAAEWIGAPLVVVRDGRTIWDVFRDSRMIGNTRLSVCSRVLKQQPTREWLAEQTDPETAHVVLGIDWTEQHRVEAIARNYRPWSAEFPLVERTDLTQRAVTARLADAGIAEPALYGRGFAHNNCAGACVRAGQGQWAHLLRVNPERYAEEERQEQALRDHLGKDVSILRDRRGGTTKPLTLTALRQRAEDSPDAIDLFDIGGCGCMTDLAVSP